MRVGVGVCVWGGVVSDSFLLFVEVPNTHWQKSIIHINLIQVKIPFEAFSPVIPKAPGLTSSLHPSRFNQQKVLFEISAVFPSGSGTLLVLGELFTTL